MAFSRERAGVFYSFLCVSRSCRNSSRPFWLPDGPDFPLFRLSRTQGRRAANGIYSVEVAQRQSGWPLPFFWIFFPLLLFQEEERIDSQGFLPFFLVFGPFLGLARSCGGLGSVLFEGRYLLFELVPFFIVFLAVFDGADFAVSRFIFFFFSDLTFLSCIQGGKGGVRFPPPASYFSISSSLFR